MVNTGHCDPPGWKFARGRFETLPIDSGCCSSQNSGFNLLLLPFAQCCLAKRRRITQKFRSFANGLDFPSFFTSLHPHKHHCLTKLTLLELTPVHVSRQTAKKTLAKKQEAHFAFGNRFSSPHAPLGTFYAVALTFHALITLQSTPAKTYPQVYTLQTAEIQPQNRENFQSSQSLRKNALLLRPIRWTDLTSMTIPHFFLLTNPAASPPRIISSANRAALVLFHSHDARLRTVRESETKRARPFWSSSRRRKLFA